jgi:hypothetical protein
MMKHLKMLTLAAVAAAAMLTLVGAGSAAATTLEIGGVKQGGSVAIEISLKAGTSMILRDTNNASVHTCTGSTMKGATTSPFTGATVTAPLTSMTFTGCSHSVVVVKPGTLHFAWTSGTNASVSSSGMEITTISTIFGASCIFKTGAGTSLGTLTGVASGHATLHVNAVLSKGICGDAVWTGTYIVTSPTGLGVVS